MEKKSEKQSDYSGVVLWFADHLGYGFIQCPDFTQNIFAHYTRIMTNEKFKTLSKGQHVAFEVAETDKRPMAINIRENKIIKVAVTQITQ